MKFLKRKRTTSLLIILIFLLILSFIIFCSHLYRSLIINSRWGICVSHHREIYKKLTSFSKKEKRYPNSLIEFSKMLPSVNTHFGSPFKYWEKEKGEKIEYEYIPGYLPTDGKITILLYNKYPLPYNKELLGVLITKGNGELCKICVDSKYIQLYLSLENLSDTELLKLIESPYYLIRTKSIIILSERKNKNAVEKLIHYLLFPRKWEVTHTFLSEKISKKWESIRLSTELVIDEEESTYIVYWALEKITGEKFGRNKKKWLTWWKKNKHKYQTQEKIHYN